MSKPLFNDSGDEEIELKTNEEFAKVFNERRKKELLQKYKDRNLSISESDDDDDSSEEDEAIDPKFDQIFFRTLASLKSKNPAIYDSGTRFFNKKAGEDEESEDDDKQGQMSKKSKPLTINDYQRKIILEHNGIVDDSDDEEGGAGRQERSDSPTIAEKERLLKEELRQAVVADDSDDDSDGGLLLKKRSKTSEEVGKEEEDYAKWLAGKTDQLTSVDSEKLEPLKKYWNSKNLPAGERFLRDYILNNGFSDINASKIPTYDDIVAGVGEEEQVALSEDEQELEKQEEFEHKYNFRYEEPDAEFIKRYPRTIESTLRRTDDKRKKKREELKERKEQEKQQKMKELEIVRDIRRKEILEKLEKLKVVTGNDELAFNDDDLEGDFDPEKHDRLMQQAFNNEYYQEVEDEKPECPADIEDLQVEDWDNYDPKRACHGAGDEDGDYDPNCEDEDFNMDCEYDAEAEKKKLQEELIDSTRKKRRGRRNRFIEMLQSEKPPFKPEDEQTLGEYIDEWYKFECEDIIGDIPCRFKYVETTPCDFGLTTEEILLARTSELNQWSSLKKAVQIRPAAVDKKEQALYRRKAQNFDLKRKIFRSIYGDASDSEEQDKEKKDLEVKPEESASTLQPVISKSQKKRMRKQMAAARYAAVKELGTQKANKDDSVKADCNGAGAEQISAVKGENQSQGAATSAKKSLNQSKAAQGDDTPKLSKSALKRQKRKAAAAITAKSDGDQLAEVGENPAKKIKLEAAPKESNNVETGKVVPKQNAHVNKSTKKKLANKANQPGGAVGTKKAKLFNKSPGSNNFRNKNHKPNGNTNNKKFKRGPAKQSDGKVAGISDDRLRAFGINPRKLRKQEKYGAKKQNQSKSN